MEQTREQNANTVTSSSKFSQPALQRVVAVLGSTGIISVLGPIVGELYWEGYLAAFGLFPQEFPATASRINLYAYLSVLEALASVWSRLLGNWWIIALIAALMTVGSVALDHKSSKQWLSDWVLRVRSYLRGDSPRAFAVRAGLSGFLAGAATLWLIGVAFSVVVVAASPVLAREAGLRAGRAALDKAVKISNAAKPACDEVNVVGKWVCPQVVVVGEDSIAVLDQGRIVHLQRNDTVLSTAMPTRSDR